MSTVLNVEEGSPSVDRMMSEPCQAVQTKCSRDVLNTRCNCSLKSLSTKEQVLGRNTLGVQSPSLSKLERASLSHGRLGAVEWFESPCSSHDICHPESWSLCRWDPVRRPCRPPQVDPAARSDAPPVRPAPGGTMQQLEIPARKVPWFVGARRKPAEQPSCR